MPPKQTKVLTRRRKFQEVELLLTKTKLELIGNTIEEINGKSIKLDMTRELRGKGVMVTFKIEVKEKKAFGIPIKLNVMSFFIRRMIRKRISYIEDSFETPSQNSMIRIKPFLITRKKVSRVVRKTLRNKAKNWIEDYISQRTDEEIFNDIFYNRMQKPLSLVLKKTYPLSLCEIRTLEILRSLKDEEIPKIIIKKKDLVEEIKDEIGEEIDQVREIEEEKIKEAKKTIKETQKKASKKEKEETEEIQEEIKESKKTSVKKTRKIEEK